MAMAYSEPLEFDSQEDAEKWAELFAPLSVPIKVIKSPKVRRNPSVAARLSLAHPRGSLADPLAVGDSSPILRIPSEIRLEILRHLLPCPGRSLRFLTDGETDTVRLERTEKPGHDRFEAAVPDSLAVLRTNRRLYYEGLGVLYSEHLFHFIGLSYLPILDFVRRLSTDARAALRRVRLTIPLGYQNQQNDYHQRFCATLHSYLPGLIGLEADPFVWI